MRKTGISLSSILSIVFVMSACKEQSSHNGHEYVDLGLSVKWATCNVGAQNPEDYGEYYAWGETITKTTYTWKNYRFRVSGDTYSDLKFSNYDPAEILDHLKKTVLDLADDVANVKWGGNWRMPTIANLTELANNCTFASATVNNVKGVKVTSNINGNYIFLPSNGYITGTTFKGWTSNSPGARFWLADCAGSDKAYQQYTAESSPAVNYDQAKDKFRGTPIRPVYVP